eukprot:m.203912 g.203912  ORF g.203912 m.203912 type:complete len:69 (-) comp53860_c0_seq29:865-1071(-)
MPRGLRAFSSKPPAPQPCAEPVNSTTAWSLRLAHENGYLSWSRNAVISTVAGTALWNGDPIVAAGYLT